MSTAKSRYDVGLQKLKETTEGMEMSEDLKAKLDTLMSEAKQSLKIDNISMQVPSTKFNS